MGTKKCVSKCNDCKIGGPHISVGEGSVLLGWYTVSTGNSFANNSEESSDLSSGSGSQIREDVSRLL
jgi:hypothetical protein